MDDLCHDHALKLQDTEKRLQLLELTIIPIQKDIRTIKNTALCVGGGIIINIASQLGIAKIALALIGLS
jgi:hypothetical protein